MHAVSVMRTQQRWMRGLPKVKSIARAVCSFDRIMGHVSEIKAGLAVGGHWLWFELEMI